MDMIKRPRRLRGGETIRKMIRETRMDKSSLIYPMFVQEGTGREDEIPSMPGQFRYTLDRLPYELERLAKAGVGSVMLFGIPDHKDEIASQAYAQDGIVQRALQVGKEKFPEFDYGMGFNDYNCDNVTMGEWTWETGMDKNQIAQAEQIRDYGLMAVYGTWSWLKNHSVHKADFRDRKLGWVAYVSGKRESRRLLGDYILKWDDIMKNVYHEDASFSTTWSIDLHFPDSLNNAQFPGRPFKADTRHTLLSAPYPVPYRCLYSRNVDNLFMAGRDISVTHVALGTTRVMRTCGMEGEVVGMAASLCHKYQVTPRMIYWNYLNELKRLMSEGTGLKNVPFNQGYNTWNKWNRHR